ncbi:MAG TPA: TadE family protein [Eoetvoesiella sp.]
MIRKNRRRSKGQRGVAALEAALILPVAVFLIFGCVELYQYFRVAALLDRVAFSVANGVSMQRELFDRNNCTQSNDICVYGNIAQDLFQPLDYAANGGLVISVYAATEPDADNKVTWEQEPAWPPKEFNGASSAVADTSAFPPAQPGDTLIVAEAFYKYTPFAMSSTFWTNLGGTSSMYSRFLFRPRFDDLLEPPS